MSSDEHDDPSAPKAGQIHSPEPPAARLRRELEAVMDIARAVSSTLDIEALLPRIMERTTQLMKADQSTLFIVDEARGELWSKVLQGDQPAKIRLRIGDGIAGWVAQHGQLVNLPDVYADARFDKTWDEKSGYRTRSLLCSPIRNKEGRVVAGIQCLNKHAGVFDADDELLLQCIGGQCAVAIENAFLYAALLDKNRALAQAEAGLRRAHAELEVLYEVERQISDAHDLAATIGGVLERVQLMLKVEVAALLLVDEGGAVVHARCRDEAQLRTRMIEPRVAQALLLRSRFPIWRTADAGGAVADTLVGDESGVQARETCSAALSDGRSQIGVLQIINRVEAREDEETLLRLLGLVAGQLARGILVGREREAGQRAERLALLGHSVGAILHDMRTPMTAVGGYVELMTEEASQEVRREHAARIARALDHMETMTQEVLSFARGQREVLIGKVYLDVFISEVREMLVPEMQRFGIELEVDARYQGVARFDGGKLKRVLFNLARNAGQAMSDTGGGTRTDTGTRTGTEPGPREHGKFRWTIDRAGDYLVFECADSGPGIPKEMEGRLFESFATHGKVGGTGLGLAMAKKIVDAHCGQISVHSEKGRGATFRIQIPI